MAGHELLKSLRCKGFEDETQGIEGIERSTLARTSQNWKFNGITNHTSSGHGTLKSID